jgi:hypothetical protein
MSLLSRIRRQHRIAIVIYVIGVIAYAAPSGQRLRQHTNDNHYVHLAYGWLHGRLDLGGPAPTSNDWATIEWIHLKDGTTLKGAMVSGSTSIFRTLRGKLVTLEPEQIVRRESKTYVSFPPFPGLAMLPAVAIWGMRTNDVIFNVLLAPLAPALLFLLLRKLRARGHSERSESDDLWLVFILGVGSVYYFSSVRGEIWYTAHICAVVLCVLYTITSLDAERPTLAGLALACALLSRPEMLFAAPLFLWEAVRVSLRPTASANAPGEAAAAGGEAGAEAPPGVRRLATDLWHRLDGARLARILVRFAVPMMVLGAIAAALNVARFQRPTEFGHTYLNVVQHDQIQRYGLFNVIYLGRNLACALALTPRIIAGRPWIMVSWHGLALWVTTPVLLYLLWPRQKGPLHWPLWISIACIALPDLLYQNSGWVQFGYRFSLDYMVFLMMLLAVGGRPFTKPFKALAIYGFAINLFGAITFYWASQFYFNSYFPPGIN